MRRAVFNYHSFEEMIERYNPFGFKYADGRICMFETYAEIYFYALKRLADDFEEGYVDLVLYVCKNTGLSISECESEVQRMRSLWGQKDHRFIDIKDFGEGTRDALKTLIKCLHTITETKFNEAAFDEAFAKFQDYMNVVWTRKAAEEELKEAKKEKNNDIL